MEISGSVARRHLNFVQYALGSLAVYKTRTLAVLFSLTVAVFFLGSVVFLADGLTREATTAASFSPDITVQGMIAGRVAPVSLTYVQKIATIPGVSRVVPRVWGYLLYGGGIYTVMGLDPSDLGKSGVPTLGLVEGRFPEPDEIGSVVVGQYFAAARNLKIGDIFGVKGMGVGMAAPEVEFKIVGIFSSSVGLYTSDMILATTLDAQRVLFLSRAAAATDICVYLTDASQTSQVAFTISSYYPELRVLTRGSIMDATEATYGLRGGFASLIWVLLLSTVVLIAWNQASTVGQDSKREVGILKTLGFGTVDILEIRLVEAVALGFISASVGVFLAIAYDVYLGAPLLRDFFLGWSASLPTYALPLEVSASRLLMLYAIAVFPMLLGSLVPAWLSAITEPDAVLRGA